MKEETKKRSNSFYFPFSCLLSVLELMGLFYIVTHLGQVYGQMVHLIRLIP